MYVIAQRALPIMEFVEISEKIVIINMNVKMY